MVTTVESLQDVPALHAYNLNNILRDQRQALEMFVAQPGAVNAEGSEVASPTLEDILAVGGERVTAALDDTANAFRSLLPSTRPGLLDQAEGTKSLCDAVTLINAYGSSQLAKAAIRASFDRVILAKVRGTEKLNTSATYIEACGSSRVAKAAMRAAMDAAVLSKAQEHVDHDPGAATTFVRAWGSTQLAKTAMLVMLDGQGRPAALAR